MNEHRPRAPRRADARLIAVLLAVVIVTFACGTTEPTVRGSDASRHALPAGSLSARVPDLGDPIDTNDPTVARLDPHLLAALQAAARDAQQDGVRMTVTSGWRSRAHQERLLEDAVRKYGSEEEARRFVSTPDTSEHVTGDAVDVGPADADAWLSRYGAAYGLCQVYANEIWHYELATTPGGRCPDLVPDASSRR